MSALFKVIAFGNATGSNNTSKSRTLLNVFATFL